MPRTPVPRRPFPQFNPFRPYIIDELTRRAHESVDSSVSVSIPFTRFTSCVTNDSRYTFFTLGLHGYKDETQNMFDLSYGGNGDLVGYGYKNNKQVLVYSNDLSAVKVDDTLAATSTKYSGLVAAEVKQKETQQQVIFAHGRHPTPGITAVNVKRAGLGTPLITTVDFTCYNRSQMEFLRSHFMTVGINVVVEWGQQFSNKQIKKLLNFSSIDDIKKAYVDSIVLGRTNTVGQWVEPNDGNYDFLFGKVSNFSVKYDATSQVYNCQSTVVSNGEQFRGLSNFFTYNDKLNTSKNISTTIAEYFKTGHGFDTCVAALAASNPELATHAAAKWAEQGKPVVSKEDTATMSTNPQDYQFLSWTGFVTKVIPQLFGIIGTAKAQSILNSLLDFTMNDETRPFDEQHWVGDNPFLKTTSLDIMAIIRSNNANPPNELTKAGYFNSWIRNEDVRGKLSKGVWLNCGMVRRNFLNTNDVESAIRGILTEMNTATDNFWKLTLYFDEDVSKYKIVDAKFTDPQFSNDFYTFNKGNAGECLEIDLDSAFPPEMITQMMLYGYYQSTSTAKKIDLAKKLPSIGVSNTFIFSMNWTSLQDVLVDALPSQKTNDTDVITSSNTSGNVLLLTDANDTSTVKSKVVSTGGNTVNTSAVSTTEKGTPGKPLNTSTLSSTQKDDTAVFTNRNDVNGTWSTNKSLANPFVDPTFRTNFIAAKKDIEALGNVVEVTSTARTKDEQNRLIKQGKTVAKNSHHLTGEAADILVYPIGTKFHGSSDEINNQKKQTTQTFFNSGEMTRIVRMHGLDTLADTSLGNSDPYHIQSQVFRDGSTGAPIKDMSEVNDREIGKEATIQANDEKKKNDIINRFGDNFLNILSLSPSVMTANITALGYQNDTKPNGHVIGFPTTTSINISILGIAGLSVSDGFMVDRIPFVFEQYGLFQIVEITESITPAGWVTQFRGIFKLMRLETK